MDLLAAVVSLSRSTRDLQTILVMDPEMQAWLVVESRGLQSLCSRGGCAVQWVRRLGGVTPSIVKVASAAHESSFSRSRERGRG